MQIRVETSETQALQQLLQGMTKSGDVISLVPGVEIRMLPMELRRSAGAAAILCFALRVGGDIAIGLAASAIYDWLKKGMSRAPEKLVIDRSEIEFEEGEVKRIITERIEHQRGRPM